MPYCSGIVKACSLCVVYITCDKVLHKMFYMFLDFFHIAANVIVYIILYRFAYIFISSYINAIFQCNINSHHRAMFILKLSTEMLDIFSIHYFLPKAKK